MGKLSGVRLLVLLFALAGTAAHAQSPTERGWYGGIAAGASKIDFGDLLPTAGASASTVTGDDTDRSYTLFAGYRFFRYLALEAGYTDFGDFSATRQVTAPAAGTIASRVKSSGVHFDVLGIIPAGRHFEFYGRLGVIRTATTADVSATGAVVLTGPAHSKEYNASPRIGGGVQFNISHALGLRIDYGRQNVDFQYIGDTASIAVLSAALVARF